MKASKKQILIIAYEFYPVNAGGSHRPYRMASYLKKNGYEPIVFTVDERSGYDESLQKLLINSGIQVRRSAIKPDNWYTNISSRYYINVQDDILTRWWPQLKDALLKEINNPNCIAAIVTAPPFSMTGLMHRIIKLNGKIKLILDMRDAWANWNVSPYATKWHYQMTLKAERNAFKTADHVLVTSEVTLQDFSEDHSGIKDDKFVFIPNSFDSYVDHSTSLEQKQNEKFTIGYVGSFYYDPKREFLLTAKWHRKKPQQWLQYLPHREEWIYRSPYFLFKTMQVLFNRKPKYKNKLEIVFAGIKPEWFDSMVEEFDLTANVKHIGKLKKSEVSYFEQQMDALLITSAKRHGKKDYSIAGKSFEYISHKKAILACVTDSAQKDLLEPTGLAVIINPDNTEEGVLTLQKVIDGNLKPSFNKDWCDQFLTENALSPLKDILCKA